jgi:hypothetical protein
MCPASTMGASLDLTEVEFGSEDFGSEEFGSEEFLDDDGEEWAGGVGKGAKGSRRPPVGGKWTKAEDERLKGIVDVNGPKNWRKVADLLGAVRTNVQCLHRWNKVRNRFQPMNWKPTSFVY